METQSLSKEAIVGIVSFISFIVIFFGAIFYYLRRMRKILNTPISKIRSAAQGKVCLQGKAKYLPLKSFISPLSQQPCCWYSYHIEERVYSKNNNNDWQTLMSGSTEQHFFFIDDGTGVCLVNPDEIEVKTPHTMTKQVSSLTPYIQKSELLKDLPTRKGKYQITESYILENDDLIVIGTIQSFRSPTVPFSAALSKSAAQILELSKTAVEESQFKIGQGIFKKTMKNFENKYSEMSAEWDGLISKVTALQPLHLIVSQRDDEIISGFSRHELVKRYRRYVLIASCLFFATIISGSWFIIKHS